MSVGGFSLLPERRSGRRALTPALEARLRGLQGVVDMLGDQIDIVLRDGPAALGPVHELLAQAAVQGRELFDEVRAAGAVRGAHDPSAPSGGTSPRVAQGGA